ncbi:MAG: CBS domain-containing protein [Candidatus Thermoplasmatota archaeon]|nr:CBS domain-containing protein [Candidatus Thermoplasmatota archaeon]
MTKEVISVNVNGSVKDAWLAFMEADISGAPVLDESGALVGVLSMTDIFRSIMERFEKARMLRQATTSVSAPGDADRDEVRELSLVIRAIAETTIGSILPKDQKVIALSPEDSLDRALHLIAEHNINRLPVVHNNQVVGIVTRQDIIWQIAGRPSSPQE